MDKSIRKIIQEVDNNELEPEDYTAKDIEALNLYYVACSRSIKELVNAKHLDSLDSAL